MWTTVSYLCVVVLVSAHVCSTLSEGSIKLCTDSPTSFVNGTAIPAMLGKAVSVMFCVQCETSLEISKFIQIKHPNHPTVPIYYFYTNNKELWRPIIVNITSSAYKATINITIKAVQKEDFTNPFFVIIHTNKSAADNSVFFFHLSEAAISDAPTSDGSLILSAQPTMPVITSMRTSPASSSTELSTVSSQAITASTSTVSHTQEITQCRPQKILHCPENWYQVDNETCLQVTQVSNNTLPKDVCNWHGAEPVTSTSIMKLRSCLLNILQQSKSTPINYEVRLENNVYVNVQHGTNTSRSSYNKNNVACLFQTKKNFSRPNSSFEQQWKGHGFESSTLHIALPSICFIIIVFISSGIVWYRVNGACTARSRAAETDSSSSGNKDADQYENISPNKLPNTVYEEASGVQYEGIMLNIDDMEDFSQAEYVEIDDVQYETPVKYINRQQPTSHVHSSEYANTITYV